MPKYDIKAECIVGGTRKYHGDVIDIDDDAAESLVKAGCLRPSKAKGNDGTKGSKKGPDDDKGKGDDGTK